MNLDKQTLKELSSPKYSMEEREKVMQYFMNLKGDLIREFFVNNDLPKSGTKPELHKRIQEYLDEGTLIYRAYA